MPTPSLSDAFWERANIELSELYNVFFSPLFPFFLAPSLSLSSHEIFVYIYLMFFIHPILQI